MAERKKLHRDHRAKVIRRILLFSIGIALGVLSTVIYFEIYKPHIVQKTQKEAQKQQAMVAPYYEPKDLQKPEDIRQQENLTPKALKTEPMKIPILMYHYVEYVKDAGDLIRKSLNINPVMFEKQLIALDRNGYKTLFVKELPPIIDSKNHLPGKPVVLSFDDGYEDFYYDVFPILKKYNMKATLYVIYDFIGRPGFVTAPELKEMVASNLVEIGSHTLDHVYLKTTPDSVAKKQIEESKADLENLLGIKVETFAYPYGSFNTRTVQMVKDAGYTAAVSVISGNMQSNEDLFYMYRIRAGAFTGTNMLNVLTVPKGDQSEVTQY